MAKCTIDPAYPAKDPPYIRCTDLPLRSTNRSGARRISQGHALEGIPLHGRVAPRGLVRQSGG